MTAKQDAFVYLERPRAKNDRQAGVQQPVDLRNICHTSKINYACCEMVSIGCSDCARWSVTCTRFVFKTLGCNKVIKETSHENGPATCTHTCPQRGSTKETSEVQRSAASSCSANCKASCQHWNVTRRCVGCCTSSTNPKIECARMSLGLILSRGKVGGQPGSGGGHLLCASYLFYVLVYFHVVVTCRSA